MNTLNSVTGWRSLFPPAQWLGEYRTAWLKADLVAGLTLAAIDTALDSPHDILPWEDAPPLAADKYRAEARSVVMLISSNPE